MTLWRLCWNGWHRGCRMWRDILLSLYIALAIRGAWLFYTIIWRDGGGDLWTVAQVVALLLPAWLALVAIPVGRWLGRLAIASKAEHRIPNRTERS